MRLASSELCGDAIHEQEHRCNRPRRDGPRHGRVAASRRLHVRVCDVRVEVAQTFAGRGYGRLHAAEVAAHCEMVVSVVVNASQTESGSVRRRAASAATMRQGSVFVMCSTVDPNWSITLETGWPTSAAVPGRADLRRARQGRVGRDDDDDHRPSRGLCQGRRVLDAMAANVYGSVTAPAMAAR